MDDKKILFEACFPMEKLGQKRFDEVRGEVRGVEQTMSDGSKVYNLEIGEYELPCRDLKDLELRYNNIVGNAYN